ncbi:MAG: acylneuraminate cytidylyltransferase [Candidatus Yanofskybacteria bacterium CG10_big_fil_rev_8_21_14_0_10_36_16]|uniref:Acylneuraminate cytidylyltransferase n=1 Tax=Candidatus Yanofskybacteria bacterium CG10_big_fil_rev_8_21_14_0_10_36_16 TaxID=1975096 RepID=A0A2J0Q7P1_9BACT|nr:MAG: acylneuraminate cytidylyltransferase [Candidatus Yanofskybacteria bacterium CG10_big_fil_rev_8_21_14_0_10_36_16]
MIKTIIKNKTKKILAFIPARGGSKGLPGKNIINIGGLPLIAHSINSAQKSKLITRIIVSTDHKKIVRVANKYGADVPFLRPQELATDKSPTIDAVLYTLDQLSKDEEKYDAVALLEPTSPLRKTQDIDNAIKILINNWNKTDAVVSVGEINLESPFYAKKIEKGFIKSLINISRLTMRRQDLPRTYFPYGVVYLCKTKTLQKERTFYPKRIMPYFIERWQNYEVDDIYDLKVVRAIMRHKKNEKK